MIVDAHQDAYASAFCGDGFPAWTLGPVAHDDPHYDCTCLAWSLPYFDRTSTVNQAFQRFWDHADGIETDFVEMWKFVAADLAGHPGVAAFEMLNEPGSGTADPATFEATSLPPFYERVGTAIRAAAGDVAVLGGSIAGESSAVHHLLAPSLPGYVFAPHYYDATAFIGIDDVSIDRIRTGVQQTITLPGSPDVPVIIGEWGLPTSNTAKAAYSEVMLQVFDELQLSTIVWDAHMSDTKWNGEDFTVFHADGTEQDWAASVVRPYPRAVAGGSFKHGFDPKAITFWTEVQSATSEVTEMYLPTRFFGATPKVQTNGARWHWIPDGETLVVAAPAGTSYRVDVSH